MEKQNGYLNSFNHSFIYFNLLKNITMSQQYRKMLSWTERLT